MRLCLLYEDEGKNYVEVQLVGVADAYTTESADLLMIRNIFSLMKNGGKFQNIHKYFLPVLTAAWDH